MTGIGVGRQLRALNRAVLPPKPRMILSFAALLGAGGLGPLFVLPCLWQMLLVMWWLCLR